MTRTNIIIFGFVLFFITQETDGNLNIPIKSMNIQPPDVTKHKNLRLLDERNCGIINQSKIIGGSITRINEFPWMVLLIYRIGTSSTLYFRCGGTIINKRYILTASHCVINLLPFVKLVGVRVGEYDLSTERDCQFVGTPEEVCADMYEDFTIEQVISHPQYTIAANATKFQNDVALIRVSSDIDFKSAKAKPICLPIGAAAKITTKKLQVAGWGLDKTMTQSSVLLKLFLPHFSQEECVNTYKDVVNIWYKQLCMGGEKNKDSCNGDSGGPLQGPANDRYVQYGIISFGNFQCGIKDLPGVYTRVDYYLDWILDNLKD